MLISTKVLRKNPVFRNFLSASTISLLGNGIVDISMPLYVWDRTHSPIALSLVSIALQLPYFLVAPLTGYAVDYYDNRKLMLLSDLGQVAFLSLLLFFDFSTSSSLWPILVAVFASKTLAILFETVATFHLIPNLVPKSDLQDANTWFLSSQRLIQIVGPLLGGLFMGLIGFRASIVINLVSFAATLFFVYRLKGLSQLLNHGPQNRRSSLLPLGQMASSFFKSVRYIWKRPLFRALVFTMFFWNLSSLTPNTATITYFFRAEKGYSPVDFGAVISIFGMFSICGFFIAPFLYKKLRFGGAFYGAVVWQAVFATIAIAFVGHPLLFILFFSLSRVGSSVMAMGTFHIRQSEVPLDQTGAINSSLRMHFMSAGPLSAGIQGSLMHHFGVVSSFAFGALCLWITAWFGKKTAESHQQLNAEPARDAA